MLLILERIYYSVYFQTWFAFWDQRDADLDFVGHFGEGGGWTFCEKKMWTKICLMIV